VRNVTMNDIISGSSQGRKADPERAKYKDKADRATVEQVLDPRTRMIIFKLLSRSIITEVNGCISTGKEANVYHASTAEGGDLAIKVYKTSILVFKDRDKYVSGEYRFRNGYCKSNPRKMVRTWAEKEYRNLLRINKAEIPSPEPLLLKNHVLLMKFIGENGWPAPRLKDADFNEEQACEMYLQMVKMVYRLYNVCKLVHADLSEYNLLYYRGIAYCIDVSQSVEHDHPHALEFLRKDVSNVNAFFLKQNVSVLTTKEFFNFVTDPSITTTNVDACLKKLMDTASERSVDDVTAQDKIDNEVFMKTFIPHSLDEIHDPERDIISATEGGGELAYTSVIGLKPDLSAVEHKPVVLADQDDISDSEDDSTDNEEGILAKGDLGRPKDEPAGARRERKKAVKVARAEKRKDKLPKHIKKRKVKMGKVK